MIEFENEKLQTFTGKTFEKGENFEKDVADFLTKLIDFHTKPTELKSNEEEKLKAKIKELENEVKKIATLKVNEEEKLKAEIRKLTEEISCIKSKKTPKIGYIAYSNGSVSEEYDRTKIPVGIVIEVPQGRFTKILSLDETCSDWKDALEWCNNYVDAAVSRNWRLPTQEEMWQLYEVKDAVNAAIDKITAGGGIATKLNNESYWSSSQYNNNNAWAMRFSDEGRDYYYGYYKGDAYSVRAVRAF